MQGSQPHPQQHQHQHQHQQQQQQQQQQQEAALLEFVSKALSNHQQGQPKFFGILVEQLETATAQCSAASAAASAASAPGTGVQDANAALQRWYRALAKCVSYVGAFEHPDWQRFVKCCLAFEPYRAQYATLVAFNQFVVSLVTVKPNFLSVFVGYLVRICSRGDPCRLAGGAGATAQSAQQHELVLQFVHATLNEIFTLVPAFISRCFGILAREFPHLSAPVHVQEGYVRALLRMSEYAEALRDRVLHLIVEKLILVDVEIDPRSLTAAFSSGASPQPLFLGGKGPMVRTDGDGDLDLRPFQDSPLVQALNASSMDVTMSPVPAVSTEQAHLIEALDAQLCVFFEYLDAVYAASVRAASASPASATSNSSTSSGGSPLIDLVWQSLMHIFEFKIMRTHETKFVQFLVFYTASFRIEYGEQFAQRLLELVFDESGSSSQAMDDEDSDEDGDDDGGSHPVEARISAAHYLTSFLSRAAYLRHASVIMSFDFMLQWIHSYIQGFVDSGSPPVVLSEAPQHAVFYSMCQGVFQVFVARQRSFALAMDDAHDPAAGMARFRFDEIVHSPLNPLRFCAPQVVENFSALTFQLRLVDCAALLAQNRSAELVRQQKQGGARQDQRRRWLPWTCNDLFLPFESFRLPLASRYVRKDDVWRAAFEPPPQESPLFQAASAYFDHQHQHGGFAAMPPLDLSGSNSRSAALGIPGRGGGGSSGPRAVGRGSWLQLQDQGASPIDTAFSAMSISLPEASPPQWDMDVDD